MTHEELVARAVRWLKNAKRCKYVIGGDKPWNSDEHPDAMGWNAFGESIVVECKVSWADFIADSRKPWRQTSLGMGFWRYFMTPPGLWTAGPPEKGEGIVEIHGRQVKVVHEAMPRQLRDYVNEINFLVARLSREQTCPDCQKPTRMSLTAKVKTQEGKLAVIVPECLPDDEEGQQDVPCETCGPGDWCPRCKRWARTPESRGSVSSGWSCGYCGGPTFWVAKGETPSAVAWRYGYGEPPDCQQDVQADADTQRQRAR